MNQEREPFVSQDSAPTAADVVAILGVSTARVLDLATQERLIKYRSTPHPRELLYSVCSADVFGNLRLGGWRSPSAPARDRRACPVRRNGYGASAMTDICAATCGVSRITW